MECIDCHNGIGDTDDKKVAHSGDFIRHPSVAATEKCAPCHGAVVSRTHNSLHEQGWGQKKRVALRYGVESSLHPIKKVNESAGIKKNSTRNL